MSPGTAPRGANRRDDRAWSFARTAPVLLETPGLHLDRLHSLRARSVGQLLLGVLMVLAFIAVVLARTSAPV